MSHPPKQLSVEDSSAQTAPCMHHLQPGPLRQLAQLVIFEQSSVFTSLQLLTVQSLLSHELYDGPLGSP